MARFTISLDDWVVNTYLQDTDNRSSRIQELIIKGYEVEEEGIEKTKRRVLFLNEELNKKDQEVAKLKQHIGRLESDIKKGPKNRELAEYNKISDSAVFCKFCNGIISEDAKRYKMPNGICCQTCFMNSNKSDEWGLKEDEHT